MSSNTCHMSGEKAKDFKGSMAKLFRYMGRYKFRFILMFIFAVAGTVFSIVGPKILGNIIGDPGHYESLYKGKACT